MKFLPVFLLIFLTACIDVESEGEKLSDSEEVNSENPPQVTEPVVTPVNPVPDPVQPPSEDVVGIGEDATESDEVEEHEGEPENDDVAENTDPSENDEVVDDESTSESDDVVEIDNPANEDEVTEETPEEFAQVTLRWSVPTRDELDALLEPGDIHAYIVHWGDTADSLTQEVELDAGQIEYQFSPEAAGDYYFSVSVVTIYGDQSSLSNVVHKYVE